MSDYSVPSSHAEVVVNTNTTTANMPLYVGITFDHPCENATFTLESYPVGDDLEFIYPDVTYTSNVTGNETKQFEFQMDGMMYNQQEAFVKL